MDIGIRDLKARLSEFVERAAGGELIRVTERGRPRAILGPLPGIAKIKEGIEQGWIRPGTGAAPARVRRVRARRSVAQTLDEDRSG